MPHLIRQKIVTGIAWEAISKIFIQIFSWTSTFIVARILSPSDYGIVAVSGIYIGVAVLISEMGLTAGIINRAKINSSTVTTLFLFSVLLSLILFLIMYFSAGYIASFYSMQELDNVIKLSAVILIINSLKVIPAAFLMRELMFKQAALLVVVGQLVGIVVLLTLAYGGYGYWSLIISVLINQSVVVLLYMKYMPRLSMTKFDYTEIRETLRFGLTVTFARFAAQLRNQSPVFLISLFYGKSLLGFYSMAQQVSSMPMDKIGSIINKVVFPSVSRVKDNLQEVHFLFVRMSKFLLLILIPIYMVLFLYADPLVSIVLGVKWLPIIPYLKILALIDFIRMTLMLIPGVFAGLGHATVMLKYNIISLVVISSVMYFGLHIDIEQALYYVAFVMPVIASYLIYKLNTLLKLRAFELILTYKYIFIATFITGFVVSIYLANNTISNWIELSAAVAVSILMFYTLGVFIIKKERDDIVSFIRNYILKNN